ncbi:preprotein translocase subunit SecG [Teichococcus oryzae]|uniref:Protein-export membrane protein SecG n=1 Tax=Teichococcus oryzae TaxID=1608942 RepID=A0A5B2TEV6_9PROT|nr:preprotein translocase subunit SecG [Pseudoroseomonas oryzae]KAA2212699.1 preprotein translocase subunit SecG [Pseudoroseomonas oryzae]
MMTVLLVLHLFVTLALIGVVLLQRSEGGGLGIGSSQGMGAFMTGRGTANLLTRTTGVLATLFMALALAMALMGRGQSGGSILDAPPPPAVTGEQPMQPSAPIGQPGSTTGTGTTPGTGGAPVQPATPPPAGVPTN